VDIRGILQAGAEYAGVCVEVTGWLVDRPQGLFIFGDHNPANYEHPDRILIINKNIMHAILREITTLVGGRSNLFYRCRVIGSYIVEPPSIFVERLFVEQLRDTGIMVEVNIGESLTKEQVAKKGDYVFSEVRPSARDWMDDFYDEASDRG
jgi:hypothetical protein